MSRMAMEILRSPTPAKDRLAAVLRTNVLPDRVLRLFVCMCAERACSAAGWSDHRSLSAIDTARRYANGTATKEELAFACADAYDATSDAGRASQAAYDVAHAVVRASGYAANATARASAKASEHASAGVARAAVAAARAARDCAVTCVNSAYDAAAYAANAAMEDSEQNEQVAMLLEIIQ